MGIPWVGTGINCYGMGMGQINIDNPAYCPLLELVMLFLADKQVALFKSYRQERLPS